MQYLHDRSAVEDLVQDFFVSLWIDLPKNQIQTSLKSYLFSAVRNRCLDYQKHQKVVYKHRSFALFSAHTSNSSPDHYFAESELREAIEKSILKLTPRCREIFELSRGKGLNNQKIAEQLHLSKRTVELQISNAIKIMRKELGEYLPLYIVVLLVL